MAKKLKVAFAGLVHDHVWSNIACFAGCRATKIVAASDPNKPLIEKFVNDHPEVKVFSDYRKMLEAAEPDIAMICTTNAATANVVDACAGHGIHVISEKPMASKLVDANRMLKACRKAKVHLMINWPTFWSPVVAHLVELVKSGTVGEVYQVRQHLAHEGPKEIGCSQYFCDWLYSPRLNGAGALMDFCCYGAVLCRYLQGKPKAVIGMRGTLVKDYIRVDDNAMLLLRYPSAISILEASWTQVGGFPYSIIVSGTEGSLVSNAEGLLLFDRTDPNGRQIKVPKLPVWRSNPADYFVKVIREDIEMDGFICPQVSRDAQEILEAGLIATDTGKICRLPIPHPWRK